MILHGGYMQNLIKVFFVLLLPILLLAQWDPDTIFIWDNDRGQFQQMFPAVGGRSWGAYFAWDDSRYGDWDTYRQGLYWAGGYNGINTPLSIDSLNQFIQRYVDIQASPANANYFTAVWEDTNYRNPLRPTCIKARKWPASTQPFVIYESDFPQKRPAVSLFNDGYFIVTWTSYDETGYPQGRIFGRRYRSDGTFLQQFVIRDIDSVFSRVPFSRVAACDSGFLVVYDDSSKDGTMRSIYAQYRKPDGGVLDPRIKVTYKGGGDTYNEDYPDVAVNDAGNIVVVWMERNGGGYYDIWAQRFQAYSDGIDFVGSPYFIAGGEINSFLPKVAVFPNGDFVVVWFDYRTNYDIRMRLCISGSLKPERTVPLNNADHQRNPDVGCRETDEFYVAWMHRTPTNFYKVYGRAFRRFEDSQYGVDSLSGDIPVTPDTAFAGGRKGWYFDNEDYDNPATPGWDEDPIPEPESVYVDLEFAIIDQIMELNTNGQYFIVEDDTLPYRQGYRALSDYEAIFMDLGYRTAVTSAGVIDPADQTALVNYINARNPTMIEGNDFGRDYNGTTLFSKYGATYMGDGAPYTTGNIDTLYGANGTSFKDLTLAYDYQELVDNYVDSVRANSGYELMMYSVGGLFDERWMVGRSIGYGTYWFDGENYHSRKNEFARATDSFSIYHTYPLCSIKSGSHPNTYAEFYRRCLGYLGLNCQPEPITTLLSYDGASEGEVDIEWNVVSDDDPSQSAEGDYKLKFAWSKMTSESEFDAAEEYYQTWNTAGQGVGELVMETLYGLPPAETLIFALKVSDEGGLWDALGAEPKAVVGGDTLTPHSICIGDNYVKDFLNNYEHLQVRSDDTLFVTWDASNFYVGFARFTFQTGGDFFIYIDVNTSDGCDSTYPWQGATGRSAFRCAFKPDYLFILENSSTYYFRKGVSTRGRADSWSATPFTGSFSEDNVINGYQYTEVRIPFSDMSYNPSNLFRLVVIVQRETLTNQLIRVYPIFNPVGTGVNITQYYEWGALPSGVVPRNTVGIIGIEEEQQHPDETWVYTHLVAMPNPFTNSVTIGFGLQNREEKAALKIYDVSGRLIKRFNINRFEPPVYEFIWHGVDENGRQLPAGVYFCELTAGERQEIEKIILAR